MDTQWVMTGGSREGFDWSGGDTRADGNQIRVEAIIGEPNFKAIWWLDAALKASKSVARVKLANGAATGFLIAPDILMTNHHVFENEADANAAVLQFNYRLASSDELAPRDEWRCDPSEMFKTNKGLDYTIVHVKSKGGKRAGDVWGSLNLRHGASARVNQRVNIIQHPSRTVSRDRLQR